MSNPWEGWSDFARTIALQKYCKTDVGDKTWADTAKRVATNVMGAVNASKSLTDEIEQRIAQRQLMPGGRFLYAAGRGLHQTQNCVLFRAEDTREGWADLSHKVGMSLMTGAGIGCNYSALRERGKPIRRTGGEASGPLALMQICNEQGRHYRQGGSRRSAIWAGLKWKHGDIFEFLKIKNWSDDIKAAKARHFDFPAPLDGTNISVCYDDEFFHAYHNSGHALHTLAYTAFWANVRQMLETGEPGMSVDVGENAGEDLRNACTEVSSFDDSDICNLASVNMARVHGLAEFEATVECATALTLANTVYSDVPTSQIAWVRDKNRRLGVGLMGLHEWLLMAGHKYEPCAELERYLAAYKNITSESAWDYAKLWNLSTPLKTRAIAPTGTIGICAETTTGIEPIFCTAYKRRYMRGDSWHYQYVVDPTARRLIETGIAPDKIEDAYVLAQEPERRVAFQSFVQKYVDHGISSTVNLPQWGSELNNADRVHEFGEMLMRHLHTLRGITAYPDGARGGQPLNPVSYKKAMAHLGEVHMESADVCDITKGGSCGA